MGHTLTHVESGSSLALKPSHSKPATFIISLLAIIALVFSMVGAVPSIAEGEGNDLTLSSPPVHHKTLTDNGDGSYTVTLTVKGEEKQHESQTTGKADVVIVFDRSGSMRAAQTDANGNASKRLQVAKDATKTLVNDLTNSDSDVKVAFIDFSDKTRYMTSSGGMSTTGQYIHAGWFDENTISTLTQTLDDITASGGTNWEDALDHANKVLATGRSDATKYIIFVTDGNPTLRMTQPNGGATNEKVIYVHYQYKDYLLTDPYWGGSWLTSPPSLHYMPTDDNKHYYVTGADGTKHTIYEIEDNGNYLFYPVDPVTHQVQDPVEMTADEWSAGITAGSGGGGIDPVVSVGWTRDPGVSGTHGTGLTDAYGYDYDRALVEVNTRSSGTTLYSVSTSTDASRLNDFTTAATGTNMPARYFDGTDTASLNNAFSEIASIITKKSRRYTDVTITDKLSQWAEFANTDLNDTVEFTYTRTYTDSNGTVHENESYTPAQTASVSGDTVTWNVTDPSTEQGNTELNKDTTYAVSFKIWPKQNAFDRAANIANEKDTADSGTNWNGTEAAETSGIYSNDFSSKDVTDYNGATTTENTNVKWSEITTTTTGGTSTDTTTGPWYDGYEHPTMNPPTSTVQVVKTWDDEFDNTHRPTSLKFTLYQNGQVVKDKDGNDVTLTLTSANADPNDSTKWIGTFNFAVAAGPDGYTYTVSEDTTDIWDTFNPTTTYQIVSNNKYNYEGTQQNGQTYYPVSSASNGGAKLQGRQTQEGSANIKNTLCRATLRVLKNGKAYGTSTETPIQGATFELHEATIGDDGTITEGDIVGTEQTSGNDGYLYFDSLLVNDKTYFLKETVAPDGYMLAAPYVIKTSGGKGTLYKTVKQSDGTYKLGESLGVLGTYNGDNIHLKMTVTDIGIPPLPKTGGPGVFPTLIGGSLLLGVSYVLWRRQRST